MRIKFILPMLIMTVATITMSINAAEAANVDIHINGYLPAPPGVLVRVDAGRPYYVERDRRVYMERDGPSTTKNITKTTATSTAMTSVVGTAAGTATSIGAADHLARCWCGWLDGLFPRGCPEDPAPGFDSWTRRKPA